MNSFEQIEELITRIEAGEITQPEALQQLDEAREFISKVHNRLGKIKKNIQGDPLALWRVKNEMLSESLFSKVINRE